jgi:hypothetical protein
VSDGARRLPVIPLLVFAGIDLVLALALFLVSGFTVGFVLIALIGVGLAAAGWIGLRSLPVPEE